MALSRRFVIALGAAAALTPAMPGAVRAAYAPRPDAWRRYEITTRVAVPRNGGPAQVWVPVPSVQEDLWSRPGETRWSTNAAASAQRVAPGTDARMVHARWDAGTGPAEIEVVSTVATRSRAVDIEAGDPGTTLSDEARAAFTAPTELLPTDGIVRETAEAITAGARTDLEKARRIYDWVVESTERNPETRGCGLGDIASMLAMGDLTGKCADLNALYVGLARSVGLPARDIYGLRVAPSAFGYKSLGAASSDVSGAQHCRAEVFVDGAGWVPVDPADVRKVVLEEPPKTLALSDPEVRAVRAGLFGAAEGNWIAYNRAHDVVLPGATGAPVPFLMYPQAEVDGVRRDELHRETFAYTITARSLSD